MMKKRNVAIAMAAVTMAGTVAPVFANAATPETHVVSNENSAKLISKVRELLRVKYTDTQKNVYEITASYKKNESPVKDEEITSSAQLAEIIEGTEDTKNTEIVLTITDKGHAKDGDKIVNKAIRTYKDNVAVSTLATDLANVVDPHPTSKAGVLEAKYNANKAQTTITIGAELEDEVVVSRDFTVNVSDSEIEFNKSKNELYIDVVDQDEKITVAEFLNAFKTKVTEFKTILAI